MSATNSASLVWKHLNGVVCLYKPAGHSWERCFTSLQKHLASDINQLQCREPRKYVIITGDTSKSVNVTVDRNYADHPLVVGPRYIPEDLRGSPLKNVGTRTSGVCLVGINEGIRTIEKLKHCYPMSTYHVVGKFGICTHNKAIDGDILYTCNYDYLRKTRVDKIIAAIQSIHRKHLIKQCGYHPRSQQAYELLASGNLRPLASDIPVVYSIKCVDWQLPYFTLEIVIVNEEEDYFLSLVDEIGMRAKNLAVAISIRCLRCSVFSIEDTLLQKHWDLQNVINNMNLCRRKLESSEQISQQLRRIDNFLDEHNRNEQNANETDEEVKDEEGAEKG